MIKGYWNREKSVKAKPHAEVSTGEKRVNRGCGVSI
jgi:hypothetical protein